MSSLIVLRGCRVRGAGSGGWSYTWSYTCWAPLHQAAQLPHGFGKGKRVVAEVTLELQDTDLPDPIKGIFN